MFLLASFALAPATIAAWLAAGLFAGWIAGLMMEEPSYGARGNFILGAVGGLIGGFAFAYLKDDDGVLISAGVALGAALLFIFAGRIIVAMKSE
jgi:uncharacterized membrane protein YeaQ/YmgE (transglycosylase-associated protein family)